MKYSKTLDFVVPVYNEEWSIEPFIQEVAIHFESIIDYRIIFIDDGSVDGTWDQITRLRASHHNIVGLRFNRNFGKEAALFAGLDNSTADLVMTIDADLQHPLETGVSMLKAMNSPELEVIHAVKRVRNDRGPLYSVAAKLFNQLFKRATSLDIANSTDFKLLKRSAVISLQELNERETFYRGLVSWFDFRSTDVLFDVADGLKSESNWGIASLVRYAINSMFLFSSAPLKTVKYVGALFFVFAIMGTLHTLFKYFMGESVEGFTTVILLALFGNSLVLMSLGIIGSYLARLYTEQKGRPRFHIEQRFDNSVPEIHLARLEHLFGHN
jgi:dolichol-phosphate mannosyltransferase